MARIVIALGAICWLAGSGVSLAQQAGSWRPSRPNSKAIVYDEKGRRLYWDNNGQIIGRYSFATGKYIAELPGRQRDEKIEPAPNSPGGKPHNLAIVVWGRGRDESLKSRSGPKVISGPMMSQPTIVRHGVKPITEGIAGAAKNNTPSSVAIGPAEMPYYMVN